MSYHHFFIQSTTNVCVECGEMIEECVESYLNECEHCLSKKAE